MQAQVDAAYTAVTEVLGDTFTCDELIRLVELYRGKPLRIEVPLRPQSQNDVREYEARRLDGLGAVIDARCELCPGVVQSLPHGLHLIGAERGILNELERFHPHSPPAAAGPHPRTL